MLMWGPLERTEHLSRNINIIFYKGIYIANSNG